MEYAAKTSWVRALGAIITTPRILLPFAVIAFIEFLFLEVLYFSARPPLLGSFGLLLQRLYGTRVLHYPGSLLLLSQLVYVFHLMVYVVAGLFAASQAAVFLVEGYPACTSQIPLRKKAAAGRFFFCAAYAGLTLLVAACAAGLVRVVFDLAAPLIARAAFFVNAGGYRFIFVVFSFAAGTAVRVILISAIPLMVLHERGALKTVVTGVTTGLLHFPLLCVLLFPSLCLYFLSSVSRTYAGALAGVTAPEINLYLSAVSIIITAAADCFAVVCVTQWILEHERP
ncbi:MAG: hypothetical protein WCG78_06780 [Candidatus Omnitrophota bacterium]